MEKFRWCFIGTGKLGHQVAEDIRAGRLESKMVPLQATSDVMHILDEVRRQIGLEYTDLE